ncbi:MAG: ABC transporter ATP-binding protein [Ferroplasma sp.]
MDIFIDNLTKKYGKIVALDSVNLDIKDHGCTGMLGPNGAGKTTMLKLATNIVKPTTGKIEIDGVNVTDYPEKALKNIGSLIEQPEFYNYLSGYEILQFSGKIKGIPKDELVKEIKEIGDLTEIHEFINRKTGGYSRGMKQRLALSVAMLGNPEIIILDEPTFGLDPKGMADIRKIIKDLSREKLVLLSTHLINEARELCDRTIIINKGKIGYDSRMEPNRSLLKVTASNVSKLRSNKILNYSIDGDHYIIEKDKNYENYEILSDLLEEGLKVEYMEKYDNIEDIYISLINEKKL